MDAPELSKVRGRYGVRALSGFSGLLPLWVAACLSAGSPAQTAAASYFEFGTVVAQTKTTMDLQTFDPQRQRVVQHSFFIGHDTHADAVHVGDSVEAIYVAVGGERALRRLILLPAGVPVAGPPPGADAGAVLTGSLPPAAGKALAASANPAAAETLPPAVVPSARPVAVGKGAKPSAARPATAVVAPGGAAALAGVARAVPAATATALGSSAATVVPAVKGVALGAPAGAAGPALPTARAVRQSRPAEECNRSSADWPNEPVRIAVIDFRYPTEREEAHDVGTTGGGSGTALADLVFDRMEALEQADTRFAFSRGDRRRLDKTDFAGAARMGRQMGVDAVLAGTFAPVVTPPANPNDPNAAMVTTYELRAGLVDTCTGQLLMRLASVACPQALTPGIDPGMTGAGTEPCRRFAVSAADATDPRVHAAAFRPALDAMLYPLEHNGTPVTQGKAEEGSAGTVTQVAGPMVSLRVVKGAQVQTGEQLAVHAWRLAKDPATYTLHNLRDEEIGRVTLTRVDGTTATGQYAGSVPPRVGDTVDVIVQP